MAGVHGFTNFLPKCILRAHHFSRNLGDLENSYCVLCYSLIHVLGIRPRISFITKSLAIIVCFKRHLSQFSVAHT